MVFSPRLLGICRRLKPFPPSDYWGHHRPRESWCAHGLRSSLLRWNPWDLGGNGGPLPTPEISSGTYQQCLEDPGRLSLIDSCLGLLLNSRCTTIHLSLVGGSLLTTNSTLIGLITAENNGPNADNNGPNSTMKLRNAWTGSVCTYIYI